MAHRAGARSCPVTADPIGQNKILLRKDVYVGYRPAQFWRLSITSFDLRYTMVPGGKVCSRTKSKFKAAKKSAKFRQGYRYQPLDSLYCCSHLSGHRVIHISPTRPNRRLQIAAFQLLWQHSASMSLTKEARSAIYVPMRIGRELGEV